MFMILNHRCDSPCRGNIPLTCLNETNSRETPVPEELPLCESDCTRFAKSGPLKRFLFCLDMPPIGSIKIGAGMREVYQCDTQVKLQPAMTPWRAWGNQQVDTSENSTAPRNIAAPVTERGAICAT